LHVILKDRAAENPIGDHQVKPMKLDLVNLRKTFDVRQLKKYLWEYIEPRINDTTDKQTQPIMTSGHLCMTDVMNHIYTVIGINDQCNSVNSAFICMLHLTNVHNLEFLKSNTLLESENDFYIIK
jgi:hypothetical protein